MALSREEQDQLDALQRKAQEADDDDNFDVEIWDETGAGAKVPYRKGKSWLQRFGIDVEPPADDSSNDDKSDSKSKPKNDKQDRPGPAGRYFGAKK